MAYIDYTGPKNIDYTGGTPGGVIGNNGLLGLTNGQPIDDVGGLSEEELLYGDSPLVEDDYYEGESELEGNEGESVYEEPNYIYDGETDLEGESTPEGAREDGLLGDITPFIPGVETHPETGEPLTEQDYSPQRPDVEVESPDTLYDEEIGDITGPGMQELPETMYSGETEAFPNVDYGSGVSEYDPQDDVSEDGIYEETIQDDGFSEYNEFDDVSEDLPGTDYGEGVSEYNEFDDVSEEYPDMNYTGDPNIDVSEDPPDFLASSDVEDLNPNLDTNLQTTIDSSSNVDTTIDEPLTDPNAPEPFEWEQDEHDIALDEFNRLSPEEQQDYVSSKKKGGRMQWLGGLMQKGLEGLSSQPGKQTGYTPPASSPLQFAPRAYSFQDVTGSNINYGPYVNQGLAGFYRGGI